MGIDDVDLTFTAADIAVSRALSNITRSIPGSSRRFFRLHIKTPDGPWPLTTP